MNFADDKLPNENEHVNIVKHLQEKQVVTYN